MSLFWQAPVGTGSLSNLWQHACDHQTVRSSKHKVKGVQTASVCAPHHSVQLQCSAAAAVLQQCLWKGNFDLFALSRYQHCSLQA